MKKVISLIISLAASLNLIFFKVAASESIYPPMATGLEYNIFKLGCPPSKLYYAIDEELDFSGLYLSHNLTINYSDLLHLSQDKFVYGDTFSNVFSDISEKPEAIPYSEPIVHGDVYPMYYYVDTTDFNNQEAGTYEIRLYCFIATTDEIVSVSDSFNVMVTDGLVGDIDGDEMIGISDATKVLIHYAQSAAGLAPESISNADIDIDGEITIQDVSFILSYYAKSSAGIPCTWEEIRNEKQ